MSASDAFFDTNVVLYLLSADAAKADQAEAIIADGGQISVQVLNEVASVARRKLGLPWRDIFDITAVLRSACPVTSLTVETHARGLQVAKRLGITVYDAMIVASALLAGCTTLYTEDLQHGQVVEGQLRICNPFAGR